MVQALTLSGKVAPKIQTNIRSGNVGFSTPISVGPIQATPFSIPKLVRIFTDTLAGGAQKIYEVGNSDHLFLYSSTGGNGALNFSFDQQQNSALLVGQIISAQPNTFSQVVVSNPGAGSITYTIVVSYGVIDFKGLVLGGSITTSPSQASSGTYAGLVTTGAAAKVFSGISNLAVIFQADPGNSAPVFIGFDNTVSATKYIIALTPGAVYVFNSFKGDLYAFSAASQSLAVSYM